MLYCFAKAARASVPVEPEGLAAWAEDPVWVDMQTPTPAEIAAVEQRFGIEMPTREEMREIEASSRVYEEDEALYLTATVVFLADQPPPRTTEISFILKRGHLVTLRFADPQPFRSMTPRLDRSGPTLGSAHAVFFWLLDGIIARLADVMERVQLDVDGLSARIFGAARPEKGREKPDLLDALERIGRAGDTMSKVRESLHTLQRLLLAVSITETLPPGTKKEARQRAKALNRDVLSLTDQVAFVNTKVDLLLNATLGMINIEQNAIIKIFSVVAVVFLPPTLIASIYGMNFEIMPELHWLIGYPFALFLMVLSAILPFLYFKRKRWL
jgi:magnesium transporter